MKLYIKGSEFDESPFSTVFQSIILFLIFFFLLGTAGSNKRHNSYKNENSRVRACRSNISILNTAVENYNLDSAQKMKNLDQLKLLEGKYLKKIIIKEPTDECYYYSFGDLTVDGIIYCDYHGDINGTKIKQYVGNEKDNYDKYLNNKDFIKKNYDYFLLFEVFFFPFLFLIFHMRFEKDSAIVFLSSISMSIIFIVSLFGYNYF